MLRGRTTGAACAHGMDRPAGRNASCVRHGVRRHAQAAGISLPTHLAAGGSPERTTRPNEGREVMATTDTFAVTVSSKALTLVEKACEAMAALDVASNRAAFPYPEAPLIKDIMR